MTINDFLKKIAKDMQENHRILSREDFYYILKYIGVKQDTSLVNDIENFYQSFLDSLNQSLVKYISKSTKKGENITHYIGFYVDKKANYLDAVKVYFPVKYEYMVNVLKTVLVYLIRNSIPCVVKFYAKATNENIVIRFYKKEDVLPFIKYCDNNFVLSDLLEKVNPFLTTNHGLGIAYDDNTVSTYNSTLCLLLSEYFESINANLQYDKVSASDFLNFVIRYEESCENEIMMYNIKAVLNSIENIILHNNQ